MPNTPNNGRDPALSIQTQQLIAQTISVIGTIAAAKGWLSKEQAADITTYALQAMGPMAMLGGVALSWLASRKSVIVTAVASLPEVKAVVTENTVDGVTLAHSEATPSNVVVNGASDAPHL